jgi:hypothetical protein
MTKCFRTELHSSGCHYAANSGNFLPTFQYNTLGLVLTLEDETDRLYRNVCKELTTTRCVVTQRSGVFIYFAVEAGDHQIRIVFVSRVILRFWS